MGTLLGAVACQESLTAPGVCPEYCPATEIHVLDTVLQDAVVRDSSYRGYVGSHRAGRIQVASATGDFQSMAVMEFLPLSAEFLGSDGALTVVSVDSFSVSFTVLSRSVDSSLVLDLYRMPVGLDSLDAFAEMAPFFHDSLLLGSVAVPDSLTSDTVSAVLPGDAFPTLEEDSLRAAVGVRLRADSAAYVYIAARESGVRPRITRFVTVAVADSTETRSDARESQFDNLLVPASPPAPSEALSVGGVPSARALVRLVLPDAIVDSSDVVRATLILPLADAGRGVVGDTVLVRAQQVLADVGLKSPYLTADPGDPRGIARVPIGAADTVTLDVTHLIRAWRGNERHPRVLLLQMVGEGESGAEIHLWSSRNAGVTPAIQITYVPLPPEGE